MIQATFDKVINLGFYSSVHERGITSKYMCSALKYAHNRGKITRHELELTQRAISDRMGCKLLEDILPDADYDDLKLYYRNWSNSNESQ